MNFQAVIVALIIAAALVYIGRRVWRKTNSFSKKSSCGADCGCSDK